MAGAESNVHRTGTVKFYIDEKLYGFLIDDESGDEIYIPVSGLIDEIKKGSKVTYILDQSSKRTQAVEVRIKKKHF
ncbi:MAG: cold shock domain-containing protein [Flavobacteriales bacterium]|nr:cold shock domain-containing protein [Flavobacteriales bacterium]